MFWKIIVIIAAVFLFRSARNRQPTLTSLKLWGKTLYRRHKPTEAELLCVEKKDGKHLLVCDIPSLQKHALISVDGKRAQQFRRYLASQREDKGEEVRPGILMEQYKVDGDTFLLTVQNEPRQAVYIPSAQREREAQQKCKKAQEAGFVLLAAGAVAGLASAACGIALVAAGAVTLMLNRPFADVAVWKERCCLKPRSVEELPADAEDEYPEGYSDWNAAAKYLYVFATKYSMEPADRTQQGSEETEGGEAAETSAETAKAAVADQVTTGMAAANETVPAAEAEETADIAQIMMEDIVAANDAPRPKVPETQGSEDALPTFSRGFQKTRYAGKNKQKDPKAAG